MATRRLSGNRTRGSTRQWCAIDKSTHNGCKYAFRNRRQSTPVDAIGIDWAEPYATRYEVQYWTGRTLVDPHGRWLTFPHGAVTNGRGGRVRLTLADVPIKAGAIRVLMHASSHKGPPASRDWRDRMGFAVAEVSLGRRRADGGIDDVLVHAPDPRRQTFTHVSCTDPWHRASDPADRLEQPGIDRLFRSGLGFGQPVMMPVGLPFDTSDNAAAELRYLARRHYPVTQIKFGEEPDGQYGSPADYGALYVALARRLRGIIPGARFGGPSLQEYSAATLMLPDEAGSWTKGFVDYLRRRGRLSDLGFFSFEYYPVENMCGDVHAKLIAQTGGLARAMRQLRADGVPPRVPLVISEYGLSAFPAGRWRNCRARCRWRRSRASGSRLAAARPTYSAIRPTCRSTRSILVPAIAT